MREPEPARCYLSRRVWLRCRTCGARPGAIHIPTKFIGLFCGKCCPACRGEAGGEGVKRVPERSIMLFHPARAGREVPNLRCGAYVRQAQGGTATCTSALPAGPCKRQVMHYLHKETDTCGYAPVYSSGAFGAWTACGAKPCAEGGVRGYRDTLG